MHEHVLDDENLMAQVARGKREALEPLVRRFATPLLTFIERMVGDRHQAEELFQDVFLAVWINRAGYQHPRSFRAWLYSIAINKCRTLLRRPSLPVQMLAEESLSHSASPVDLAIATETSTLVATAVALLASVTATDFASFLQQAHAESQHTLLRDYFSRTIATAVSEVYLRLFLILMSDGITTKTPPLFSPI